MLRLASSLALLLALTPTARARLLPTRSVRELAVFADAVVLAVPIEPAEPRTFRVLEVLRGPLRRGDVIALELDGLYTLQSGPTLTPEEILRAQRRGEIPPIHSSPRRLDQAVLFLGPPLGGNPRRFRPVSSGLRFWSADGKLLVPTQVQNPGGYSLVERAGPSWSALLQQVREDVATVNRLRTAKALARPGRRNRELLDWVERHWHEFGATRALPGEEPVVGWGELETQVLGWVLESGRPEDAWQAVRLFAVLNRGRAPTLSGPAFGSREGRVLLRKVTCDEGALLGDRVRALDLLTNDHTLRPAGREEQAGLMKRLVPLLTAPWPELRAAAARFFHRLSYALDPALHATQQGVVLPALVAAYRAEPPGPARDDLAETVCVVGGPKRWAELSGNPPGLVVFLRDLDRHEDQVRFWLARTADAPAVTACPTLILERLEKGKVVEKKELPLPVMNLTRPWAAGWKGAPYLLVQLPYAGLKPGTWRVGVQGVAGPTRARWHAEPRTFVLRPAQTGGSSLPQSGPGQPDQAVPPPDFIPNTIGD